MPWCKCPDCDQTQHVNVPDVKEWLAKRHPDYNPGDLVPEYCYDCFKKHNFADSLPKDKTIVLIGHQGSGKTTLGKFLSEKTDYEWIDTDFLIGEKPEEEFRLKEKEVVKELAEDAFKAEKVIVSTGGGTVLDPENREILKQGFVVWLTAPKEVLLERIKDKPRPFGFGDWDERNKIYEEMADMKFDTQAFREKHNKVKQ
jgi:shikimate kinase